MQSLKNMKTVEIFTDRLNSQTFGIKAVLFFIFSKNKEQIVLIVLPIMNKHQ